MKPLSLPSALVALSLALVSLSLGCGVPRSSAPSQHTYVLLAERPGQPAASAKTKHNQALRVRAVKISPAFAGREMIYRVSETQFESDFYNQWLVPPAQGVNQSAREWLAKSGLFSTVVDEGSQAGSGLTLEITVNALYGDFRNPTDPKAVLELQAYVLRDTGKQYDVVWKADFSRAEPFAFNRADQQALAASVNKAMGSVMAEMEMALALADLNKKR